MDNIINLKNPRKQAVKKLSEKFCGRDPVGNEMAFTSYYLTVNGKPFFGISGECHYSRVQESQWEDTILKMKMGGLNIVSAYCFWNHHEEIEGKFRFDGNRNVRKFIELCKKHGMYVIVRIGPYDHGEVRNGGIPDWMYGKPFEVRTLSEGWLSYTRRLYHQYAHQFEGLYFKDGGPIIGAQIENEYMHSSSPWEMTTGVTNEWVPAGSDGAAYMRMLKKMAEEEGIITPFYTCTGWGGAAAALDEMLPLWGGYAFQPWIFYDYKGEHPATEEYIYRDNHNNAVPETYNFAPCYEPESLPYACCEMGGGMQVYYNYRFQLDYESIDAMANIKMAGGCNFLGYYMYRGGSNPRGEKTPYLNECQCPKISYDYQAPIGEYGQVRPSYHRLRALHSFIKNFQEQLCDMVTVLPENSQKIRPEDTEALRYAVRTDGTSGYVFINNYQDHCKCQDKKHENLTLQLENEEIHMEDLSIAAGEEVILPFGMEIGGRRLLYAAAQPLSVIREKDRTTFFFFIPDGMSPKYVWENEITEVPSGEMSFFAVGENARIVTLTRKQSLMFYEIEKDGTKTAVLCSSPLVWNGTDLEIESPSDGSNQTTLLFYPAQAGEKIRIEQEKQVTFSKLKEGLFEGIQIDWQESLQEKELETTECGCGRFQLELPEEYGDCKDAVLRIDYNGDVGHLFCDGVLISDNFCNGAIWEVGLKEVLEPEMGTEAVIYITPRKKNVKVDVSSTMAGRVEQLEEAVSKLRSVKVKPVRSIRVKYPF